MNKYRPEKIQLKVPPKFEGEFRKILDDNLHKRAKLTREDDGERIVFSFWPTKSEYFVISLLVSATAEKLGGKPVNQNDKKEAV